MIGRFLDRRKASRREHISQDPKAAGPETGLLADKTALIIGAGPTIGLHVAEAMLAQGATVHCTDIDASWASKLELRLVAKKTKCRVLVSDISDFSENDALLAQLSREGIGIDILVLNACLAINSKSVFPEYHPEVMSHSFATNLFGPVYLTRAVARDMIASKRQGSIIFLSSIHQWVLHKNRLPYTASKAALGMTIRELAMDLAAHGIRVNGIAPGYVSSNNRHHPPTPLYQRPVQPEYIGRAAVMLAADYFSRHTTGEMLTIDGGLSLHSYLTVPGSIGRQ